ncbi:unnamed protein product [Echinostoma caproni]|uniref:Glypican-6 n=1 Tax=Echinostoma caproni TaxID=27848 RepID=A0A183B066_9TREM|nr:unnamed protein product [Echinostoma caproni]
MIALDSSFQNSYGYNYQKNKDFFVCFFENLESYMLGKRQNLSTLVDDFFHELLIRIVRLLLFAKSSRDLAKADCVSLELEKQNPFDRIPEGIKRMAIRAFPPARMTANALLVGSEVISAILKEMELSRSCLIDWMKLRYCNFCFGEADVRICPESCRSQISDCMNEYHALDEPWTQFIDHLLAVIDRLRGSDSFPQVNRPLQIHITDAIMSFQRLFSRIDLSYLSVRSLFSNLDEIFCSSQLLRDAQSSGKPSSKCWNGKFVSIHNSPRKFLSKVSSLNPTVTRLITRLRNVTQMLHSILKFDGDPDFMPIDDPVLEDRIQTLWNSQSRNCIPHSDVSLTMVTNVSVGSLSGIESGPEISVTDGSGYVPWHDSDSSLLPQTNIISADFDPNHGLLHNQNFETSLDDEDYLVHYPDRANQKIELKYFRGSACCHDNSSGVCYCTDQSLALDREVNLRDRTLILRQDTVSHEAVNNHIDLWFS